MHLSKAGQVISSLALVHVATKHLDRLNILRKGTKLPRLITIASEVPTIIKDYNCSSWLNGKWPRKRRESKIWLIIAHSLDNFIRSELPAWKGDMAKVEIGKRRKMWRNWEPFYTTCKCSDINKQEYDQTGTSNPNMQKYMMLFLWVWFFIQSGSSNLAWSLNSICHCLGRLQSELPTFFRFLGVRLTSFNVLEQVTFQQVITTCTCVAKLPNKKIWL